MLKPTIEQIEVIIERQLDLARQIAYVGGPYVGALVKQHLEKRRAAAEEIHQLFVEEPPDGLGTG